MEFVRYVIYCLSIIVCVSAYPYFQDDIPNGRKVPNPCRIIFPHESEYYKAVGHHRTVEMDRNKFGLDFHAVKHNWTALCTMDSDGDGWTNGEELGDENCVWDPKNNATDALLTDAKSHPGVKEWEIQVQGKKIRRLHMAEVLHTCNNDWLAW